MNSLLAAAQGCILMPKESLLPSSKANFPSVPPHAAEPAVSTAGDKAPGVGGL